MSTEQPVAVAELNWCWSTLPALDYERTPPDNRLSMDNCDAITHSADRPRPRLAA
ncbi:hypothetical protein ACQP1G_07185 [Nocardia sp. CA-107356]|uniref:hypothetical protein n=1 Tax=Nocardia sp. CA-107356 TaxID=3239972 RepID=UPI003D908963